MNLSVDCVRDILLFLEEFQQYEIVPQTRRQQLTYISDKVLYDDSTRLVLYSNTEIEYTVKKLYEANMLACRVFGDWFSYHILDITYDGHKFLNNIRDDGIWKKQKRK